MNTQKDGRLGIRMPKDVIKKYNEMCLELNSIASIRVRKFVETELKYYKQKKDLLKSLLED